MDPLLGRFSYLKSANIGYIDELFEKFQEDPASIDPSWRYFFEGLELGGSTPALANGHAQGATMAEAPREAEATDLIRAYRELGHRIADINPLSPPQASLPELEQFQTAKFRDVISRLRETYCGKVGIEYAHIQDAEERRWLEQRIEAGSGREALDRETRVFIFQRLSQSETLERFLHTRYVAQKRFSIEGAESVIPALDCMIEAGAELGAREVVIGMAHRGRLNVLVNLVGKNPESIFSEFEGTYKADPSQGEGDVKYHMGYSGDVKTRSGKEVHLSLGFNPSHLEFINPVMEGIARGKQDYPDRDRNRVIPIQIHGDAAFSGQGVVYETLNFSQLEGYATGGTIHLVINNQIGFTTSPRDGRSTPYCTDMAKMLGTPIFHVNGDAPEAVWRVSRLCAEYRRKFHKDVFIDLVCYRKHGHNEGDEPSFTQPLLYKKIKEHPSTREIYAAKLASDGVLSEEQSQAIIDELTRGYTEAQHRARAEPPKPYVSSLEGRWKGLAKGTEDDNWKPVETAVDGKALLRIAEKINRLPAEFHLHPKLGRFFEARLKAIESGKGIDWGNGEALAFATLLDEGTPVRLSGQDAERGTFTHRHSVLTDYDTGVTYTPLNHIRDGQAGYEVYNSLLSETGVMGFEFGYSLADPKTLTLWEAQFGDFANGAQVIIDQFLASSESKWRRMSGLTLLLPHGYEGQAAEHSSARLERFLQLCGRDNLIVCNLTTPAQLFHVLRRQARRNFRKPLVIMSPKSLLRHPQAISDLKDFSSGGFQEVIHDPTAPGAKRVLLCSGKIYYELLAERANLGRNDVAILRVEQLYPWAEARLSSLLAEYPGAKDIVWVQEEPRNMGAWAYVFNTWMGGYGRFIERAQGRAIRYVGRERAASPAVGSAKIHEKEQKALVEQAFGESS